MTMRSNGELEDHRRGQAADDGARQPGPRGPLAADKNNEEGDADPDQGNGRDGIGGRGLHQVDAAFLPDVEADADQERRYRDDPGHEHDYQRHSAGPGQAEAALQPGSRQGQDGGDRQQEDASSILALPP
jgi:hypothetical protein